MTWKCWITSGMFSWYMVGAFLCFSAVHEKLSGSGSESGNDLFFRLI